MIQLNSQSDGDTSQRLIIERAVDEGKGEPPVPLLNDELFIKKALELDYQKGVELLYRRYFQPLCSHAIKFVGGQAIAEDLVSDVFYTVYKDRVFTNIATSYRFYLFRAVRNRAYNFLKWELSRQEPLGVWHDVATAESQQPDAMSQFDELYQVVQQAINSLPVDRRRIYLMNRFEGKRYQEIADELTLSVKTVEVQLYRANKFIRSLLKEKWLLVFVFMLTN
ncbi:RNA polymerase sigma-70 factor [Spirosoma endbachense]|uniref:RNA polymerase sigma-70 factor n=1 Tax=Spirosoma endbachense TaxID=2666025 RepID=A0A6P1W8T8_9BACT|nr:RNA polymerase sigma-70 factor [Spirosoma endbachense]QHW00331.1 RNA polymerase sigma-70 factor [Spirosoma endbachense]